MATDDFGQRIKGLLKSRGVNQSDFAANIGMSQARFNNYLTGKTEASYEVLVAVAESLSVSVDYLLGLTLNASECRALEEGEISPMFAQTVEEGEDDFGTVVWVPAYKTLCETENINLSQAIKPDSWIKSEATGISVFGSVRYLIQTDDSMAPYALKGDRLFVTHASYEYPASELIDGNALYSVRLSKDDTIGRNIRYCYIAGGVIFIRCANPAYKPVSFELSKIDFNPIAGKVLCLFR